MMKSEGNIFGPLLTCWGVPKHSGLFMGHLKKASGIFGDPTTVVKADLALAGEKIDLDTSRWDE